MAPRNRVMHRTPVEQPKAEEVKEVFPETIEEPVVETLDEPAPAKEIVEVNAVVDGVSSCLNIRREPEVKSNNQVAILGKGTKIIVIDPEKPVKNKDGEWVKVKIKNNGGEEHGYAMKKYIKII